MLTVMKPVKRGFLGIAGLFLLGGLSALPLWAGNFETGSELFLFDKPAEALPFMERAVIENPNNAEAHYRLGIIYEQLKQYDKAISSLRSAMDRNYASPAELLGRMAKNYLLKGDMDQSLAYNTKALEQKPDYAPVLLNRANLYVKKEFYPEAVADYRRFIEVDPQNPLKPEVVRMIQAILGLEEERALAKKKEEERLAAEAEQKRKDEAARLAAEEKRRQEEAKRLAEEAEKKRQLDALFDSLNEASTEQLNLSAGTEDIQNKQSDLQLED